jgi:Tfp pilus assembly protein FimT
VLAPVLSVVLILISLEVIAIIAVLAGILFPVFAQARGNARLGSYISASKAESH